MSNKKAQGRPGIVIGSKLKAPQGGKWVSRLGGFVQSYEPEPDAKTQSIEAAIDAGVAAFKTHQENILAVLRNAYERGRKSESFDADRAWRYLTTVAFIYFWRKKLKQEAVLAADRSKRLGKIAKVLGEACRLFDEAKQDELCYPDVDPDARCGGLNFVGHVLGHGVFLRFLIEDQAVVATERATLLNARSAQDDRIKGACG
jgi:hypothetical protein